MENEFRREVFVLKPTSKEEKAKLRVAAYCRVSTDSEDQVHSFIAQVRYYNDFIRGREDMVLVEVYAVSILLAEVSIRYVSVGFARAVVLLQLNTWMIRCCFQG